MSFLKRMIWPEVTLTRSQALGMVGGGQDLGRGRCNVAVEGRKVKAGAAFHC